MRRLIRGRAVTKLFYARRKELAIKWMIDLHRKTGLSIFDCAHLAVPKFGLLK